MSGKNNKNRFRDQVDKWNERHFKYLDIIVSSGEIRKRFFSRCKELQIDPIRVALEVGLSASSFKKNYINSHEPVCTRGFDQEKFLKMVELVGIDIKVLVVPKPFAETYVRLKEKGLIKDDER
jgi:hypothetical protein